MNKTSLFEFSEYRFELQKRRVIFKYKIKLSKRNSIEFKETLIFPQTPSIKQIPSGLLQAVLDNIHIMLGISYYKLYCPQKIKVNRPLSREQANFWDTVYRKGLGEFLYRNNINPTSLAKFPFKKGLRISSHDLKRNERCLVGMGGGKDSIVALELLKKHKKEVTAFVIQTQKEYKLIDNVLKESGVRLLKIRRHLDNKLFKKLPNSYEGHIPISAIYAFLGLLTAVLYDYSYLIVANEYSSNFGNLKYKGEVINHQWSKSSEFEHLFKDYVKAFITSDINYFSLLRPFYEIRIAKMFSKYTKYFSHFSSCNKNFQITNQQKEKLWCAGCAKCAFSFAILAPFISKKDLISIFGRNLFNDKDLLPLYKDLLGFGGLKPFDCVGTFEETQIAFYLAKDKYKNDLIMKTYLPRIKKLPLQIHKVFSTNPSPFIPPCFKFLGMKSALVLGYGREGKITHRYLKKYYPKLKIGIAEQKKRNDYLLDKQKKYDIVIKTPGIPKQYVTTHYTTATNIFFSQIKNKIIGVTGSKGKSTTATLIYEILKAGGIKAKLFGNIGKPMLEYLMKPINQNGILVLELSSYQLDDISFSPNIAVVTTLFHEHMDYHNNVRSYYSAKKNIINYQKGGDSFVYNPKIKVLTKWAQESKSKPLPFINKLFLEKSAIPLLGKHNVENIKAAVTVAKLFNLSNIVIKKAIKNFKPLPHRLEFIGIFLGIKFYDDAISTTPESTIMAIKSLSNIKTIFLGGEDRGYDFTILIEAIKKHNIKNVVLFPDSGMRLIQLKKTHNVLVTSDMKEAVKFAYKYTPRGSTCLLSCASPSYSLWKNFEEKGNSFQLLVKKLSKK